MVCFILQDPQSWKCSTRYSDSSGRALTTNLLVTMTMLGNTKLPLLRRKCFKMQSSEPSVSHHLLSMNIFTLIVLTNLLFLLKDPLPTRFLSTRGQRSCCSSWGKFLSLVSTPPWGLPTLGNHCLLHNLKNVTLRWKRQQFLFYFPGLKAAGWSRWCCWSLSSRWESPGKILIILQVNSA